MYQKLVSVTDSINRRLSHIDSIKEQQKAMEPIRQVVKQKFQDVDFYPKVSIVIPVYNGGNYMRDAIDSALAQTYPNIEVIVVNDGSRDRGETEQIAKSYGDLIQYYAKENGGVATALNYGIEKMTGEYFSWLSHDDMYRPEKVEHELAQLIDEKDKTIVVAEGYQVVDAAGKYLYTVDIRTQYDKKRLQSSLFCLLHGGINGCGMLIHKSQFARVGCFDPKLPTTQDFDLWFRMFRGQRILFLSSSNVLSRSHPEQGSKALLSTHVKECDALWIRIMSELSNEERIEISGSNYLFYKEILEFLRSATGYQGAIRYANQRMLLEARSEYEKTGNPQLLSVLAENCGLPKNTIKNTVLPCWRKKTDRPRVFFQLGDRSDVGGLNRIVVQTANVLAQKYDVFLGSWGENSTSGYETTDQVTEVNFEWPQDKEKYASLLALMRVDVYVFSYCCLPDWLPLIKNVKEAGIKTIAWSHEDYFLPVWRPSLLPSLPAREKYLPEADAVIWLNKSSLALYRERFPNGVYLPNQTTQSKTATSFLHPRGKNLVAVGRFDDECKGLGDLLRCFALVRREHPDAQLYVVGRYDLQLSAGDGVTCEVFIHEAGLDSAVNFVGWTEEIEDYYRLGVLHIMPSYYEGFGLVVLEAAENGTPTIAYDSSGMEDIITDGVDGCLVPRGDWKAMAVRISEFLSHPEEIRAMDEKLPVLLERYAPENIARRWEELLYILMSADEKEREAFFARQDEVGKIHVKRAIQEYENTMMRLCEREVISTDEGLWHSECLRMQSSLSWRITRPLRLVKKVISAWKEGGLRLVWRKTKHKIFHQ